VLGVWKELELQQSCSNALEVTQRICSKSQRRKQTAKQEKEKRLPREKRCERIQSSHRGNFFIITTSIDVSSYWLFFANNGHISFCVSIFFTAHL